MKNKNSYSQLELMQARVKSVPEEWSFNYIGKVFYIRNHFRKPISEDIRDKNPGIYPYYGPTKIQGYIGTFEQDGSYALIGEDGDHFLKYRTQSMTQLIDGKCTVNNHAHIIEGTKSATREWFYYYFMHRDIFSFLSRQGASRYKLNKASLEKIPLLIPPLPEQKKIAQILSTWDKAITTTEQLLANSQQQKKALMQQLLTGKKRLLDNSGARFSGEFKRYQFSEVLEVDVKSISSKTPDNFEFNYISLSDVERGVINKKLDRHSYKSAPSRARRVVSEKDILLATVRPNLQAFAQIAKENATCIASTGFSVLTAKDDTCSDYVYQYLFSAHITDQINALVVGTNYPAINSSDVLGLNIYCPKLEEQQKIAAVLSSADQEIDSLQQKIEVLKKEKKALMQQLLTGKRRVKLN